MNQEIKNELIKHADEILVILKDSAQSAIEFGKVQLPDIAEQFIRFSLVWETSLFALACVTFFGFVALFIFGIAKSKELDPILTGLFGSLVSLVWLIVQGKDTALVWFAPKLYLIQQIVSLVK